MDFWLFSPSWILILGGLIIGFVPERVRNALILALPLLTLAHIWSLAPHEMATAPFAGYELMTVYSHPFTRIFATAFALAALGGGLFAMHSKRKLEIAAGYVYAGGAIGVSFAGDLITFFLFWESMAIFSTLVIWSNPTPEARAAGMRYALMHFLGGVVLMAGIAAQVGASGTILIPNFALSADDWTWSAMLQGSPLTVSSIGTWLILTGVLINVAAPPFSSWLSDSYAESSPSGMVFLSAFTTKTAVFALLTQFSGVSLLIPIGLFMIFYGIAMAVLENDMRRVLAFAIINQTGFMMVGAGIGTELALQGAATHAFACVMYLGLLIMAAGSVLEMTGKRRCSELGGLFRSMPITTLCAMVGSLAIASMPFTSGFVSKSLIAGAAANAGLAAVWFALMAAAAGAVLHAGLKFPWFVFFHKDSGLRPADPPETMQLAMVGFAALCIIPALAPHTVLYGMFHHPVDYDANSFGHAVSQLQLMLFAALAFFLCLPILKRTSTITLDFDWFYRRLGAGCLIVLERTVTAGYTGFLKVALQQLHRMSGSISRLTGPKGMLSETRPLANTTLIVVILLASYLLLYLNS